MRHFLCYAVYTTHTIYKCITMFKLSGGLIYGVTTRIVCILIEVYQRFELEPSVGTAPKLKIMNPSDFLCEYIKDKLSTSLGIIKNLI